MPPNLRKYRQMRNINTSLHEGIGKVQGHSFLLLFDSCSPQ